MQKHDLVCARPVLDTIVFGEDALPPSMTASFSINGVHMADACMLSDCQEVAQQVSVRRGFFRSSRVLILLAVLVGFDL